MGFSIIAAKEKSMLLRRAVKAAASMAGLLTMASAINAQPANDTCGNAIHLNPLVTPYVPYHYVVDNSAAGNENGAFEDCGSTIYRGIWMTVSGPTQVEATWRLSGTSQPLRLALFDNCETFIFCFDLNVGSSIGLVLQPGETRTVLLGFSSSDIQGPIDMQIEYRPEAVPPANDECSGALPLVLGQATTGAIDAATKSLDEACGLGNLPSSALDVWYSLTVSQLGLYTFNLSGTFGPGDAEYQISVYSDCGITQVGQCAGVFGSQANLSIPLEPGAYLVRVANISGFPQRYPGFMLTASGPQTASPGDICQTAIPFTGSVASGTTVGLTSSTVEAPCGSSDAYEVWRSFNLAEAGYYTFAYDDTSREGSVAIYTSCDGNAFRCGTIDIKKPFTAFYDAGNYLLRFAYNGGYTGPYTIRLWSTPANDTCDQAQTLNIGANVGSNMGASPDLFDPTPCGQNDIYSVWYKFTATTSATYRFSTRPKLDSSLPIVYDTILSAHDGCGEEANVLACSEVNGLSNTPFSYQDPPYPECSKFEIYITSGQTVYVREAVTLAQISSFPNRFGEFYIDVASACAADFNGDNVRDVADLFTYINAWLAKATNANFNHDAAVDVADLFAYINAWLAGC